MGDRNYYPNQYSSFTAQNYGGYNQSQQSPYGQPQKSLSSLFDLKPDQSHTNLQAYSGPTGSSYNQREISDNYSTQATQYTQFGETSAYCHGDLQQTDSNRPPPSYDESRNDILLSRSHGKHNSKGTLRAVKKYSPAWSYIQDTEVKQPQSQNRSFSDFFDIPEKNYQGESQGNLEPCGNFSQQHSTAFSSDYKYRSDNNFSHRSDATTGQGSDYNNRRFGEQNHKQDRGRGGFRGRGGRGNWQNPNSQVRGRSRWDEQPDIGKQQTQKQDNFADNKNANCSWPDSNVERVTSVFEDYGDDRKEEDGDEELNIQEEEIGDERTKEDIIDDNKAWAKVKINVFEPDDTLKNRYRFFPPISEEMGEMFKDLVIHFFYKTVRNKRESNPFVVICESFRRSTGYANLEVEDGFDFQCKDRKFCTLRYSGIMMVRGVGENSSIKEARVLAAVELINKLAMSCYTLQAKPEYFSIDAFERLKRNGSVPGVYRIVPRNTAHDFESAREYLNELFLKEGSTDEEQMFDLDHVQGIKLKGWASKRGYEIRVIVKEKWFGVSRRRTPQYWRDTILASGSMETEKYVLVPPQGIGNLLMPDFNPKLVIPGMRPRNLRRRRLTAVYGPHGVGPVIRKGIPPWERKGGSAKNRKAAKRQEQMMMQFKQGVPLTETRGFKFLSRKKKQKIRMKLGVSV